MVSLTFKHRALSILFEHQLAVEEIDYINNRIFVCVPSHVSQAIGALLL
jgi:hypothetical protein